MRHIQFYSILLLVIFVIDFYAFQGVKFLIHDYSPTTRKVINIIYWSFTVFAVVVFTIAMVANFEKWNKVIRLVLMGILTVSFFTKLFFFFFVLIDDFYRGVQWIIQKVQGLFSSPPISVENPISRSAFLLKTGLVVSTVPLIGMTWGIISGAHDYRVRRIKLALRNLPSSFNGLKIVQLSDIHAGSFYNRTAVKGGVEMVMKEKADVIFFTGDLVNNEAVEMKDYVSVFSAVKAPLGVYSTLGNHDYGDYLQWPSLEAKYQNLKDLMAIHREMGWNLLMNENKLLKESGDELAILGVENWGAKGRFPKYGKLKEAVKNTEQAAVKILLSHDPSHWDAQVRPQYPSIDLTLSGHTHGMQFGIENEYIKWSPVKYMYDQWAGLYTKGEQHIYVNRGFGYIGFPGRIGILPEITVIELVKA